MQLTADSRFAIKKSLPGVGKGLFAVSPIKKGAFVLEYVGERIATSEANDSPSRYLFEINDNWTIDGPVQDNIAGFIKMAIGLTQKLLTRADTIREWKSDIMREISWTSSQHSPARRHARGI